MAIIVDSSTRLVVQGITGREGSFHATRNLGYGTNVVAGVTPGKGGGDVEGIPVFDSVREAMAETSPNAAMVFVPARFAADAIYEARAPAASAASRATSVGFVPTRIPWDSRACFLARAVPALPEMMAPAWPIVLPGGAVKPAM